VDYKIHTHATYAVCDAADAFQAAPAYTRKLASDKAKQAEQVGRCALLAVVKQMQRRLNGQLPHLDLPCCHADVPAVVH
jgi:hypothetical protein